MEAWINRFSEFDSHLHELANTNLIQFCKWIVLEDLSIIVSIEELTSVITGESVCHLCKVVCSEAEEVSFFCDIVSCKSSSWDLDHCTNLVLKVASSCCDLSVSCLYNEFLNVFELFDISNEWDHDLRFYVPIRMSFLYIDCCTDNSACLHLSNLWVCNCKTASTVSHHWVELVQAVDNSFDLVNCFALSISQFLDVLFLCRNELMKRWVKETNCNRVTFKSFVKFLEVSLLLWKNLSKCCFSLFYCICTDHFTECSDSVFLEEHMLCTAKSDTFCTKLTSFLSVSRCISVCTNLHSSVLVSPSHDSSELTSDCSVYSRDDSVIDSTCGSIK